MKWMDNLYLGDWARKRSKKIIAGIRRQKWQKNVYVLMLSTNPANQVDILSANYLLQPYYKRQEDLTIVGLACGYEEAVLLLMNMVDECYKKTGTGELRRFLMDKIRREGED